MPDVTSDGRPRLSVVVVSFNRPLDVLERCLKAIERQNETGQIETIVVRDWHADEGEHAAALGRCFPRIAFLAATDTTVPHMRRRGVAESHGEIVALIEDDCIVDSGWSVAVLRAHAEHHVAVGGAVEPGTYRSARDWAAYLCDYGRYMLPFVGRESWRLPGNNVSYKRDAVPELLTMTEADGLQETFVHKTWYDCGKPLLATPLVVVRNEHRWTTADLSTVPFHHARAFGGRRARAWGLERRMLGAAAMIALPAVHVGRIALGVVKRRRAIGPLVRALPWIALFGVSWAAGECVGYAAGPAASAQQWR